MYRILVADKLAPKGLALLEQDDRFQCDVKVGISPEELASIIGEYDGLLIRSGAKVTAQALAKPGKLRAIARAGVGVDNVDLPAATRAGVLVMNTPDANTISTAELTIGLMLALSRNVVNASASLRAGKWERSKFVGTQLAGKTLGLVGLGRIGKAVAKRALALEMKVLGYDPFFSGDSALDGQIRVLKDLDEILSQVDYLSVHTPGGAQTKGLIGSEQLAKMKSSACVINCARGGIIDESALAQALNDEVIAGAAVDVYTSEPPTDRALIEAKNMTATPHLGASTKEAQLAVSVEAVKSVMNFLSTGEAANVVNVAGIVTTLDEQTRPIVDLARRAGAMLSPLSAGGIKQAILTFHTEQAKELAQTLTRFLLVDLLQPHLDESLNLINVMQLATERGLDVNQVKPSHPDPLGAILSVSVCSSLEAHSIVMSQRNDGSPCVLRIDGYRMNMVPAGQMILIFNDDKPGVIGAVGDTFGKNEVNIADMTISRQGDLAMMVIKIDAQPSPTVLEQLAKVEQIRKVFAISLPELSGQT